MDESRNHAGKHSGGVKMFEMQTIDRMARLRREEINREVMQLSMKRGAISRELDSNKPHLDLNIQLVLQPRLSLSIWLGKGVR